MAGAAFLLFILSTLTNSSYGNNLRTLSHDTIFPAPVTLPTYNPTPTIVTVPVTVTPTNPASTPLILPIPSTTPVINPSAPITVPGGGRQQRIANAVTTYPAPTRNVPVVAPPATTNNAPPPPRQVNSGGPSPGEGHPFNECSYAVDGS